MVFKDDTAQNCGEADHCRLVLFSKLMRRSKLRLQVKLIDGKGAPLTARPERGRAAP
jgi:hypothetical protein